MWGETHRDIKTEVDRENHENHKATEHEPRSPKLDPNGPESGPSPAPPRLAFRPQSGLSRIHSIFICFAFHFELN